MPELRVGVLLYGAFESMVLPPPVIWKDLGLVNGMEDEEAALDEELAALPVDAGMDPDEENGWMTRWVNDKVSMLEIYTTPGITVTSFIPQQVRAAGFDIKDVLSEIVENQF